jgi:4-hydroxybenzoate polyprenyltransferase
MPTVQELPAQAHRLLPYAQLVRLPNVFTALADISLGALAAHALPERWLPFLLLALASACLYMAGMVWNDYFDVDQDRRERPFRPIPSGRVSARSAAFLGTLFMVVGVGLALLSGWQANKFSLYPGIVALLLVGCIFLYDAWLKRTAVGPVAMGSCRFFNVLLGLAVVPQLPDGGGFHLALAVGIYIVGVTWFARTEARQSKQSALAEAGGTMLVGLLLALTYPAYLPPDTASPLFPYLLVVLGFLVGIPVCQAIARPSPSRVQPAVKRAIFGLVLLDAALATACVGWPGLFLVLLLIPAMHLGRWVYST